MSTDEKNDANNGAVTLEQLRSAARALQRNAATPFKVKNKDDADKMTANDPCGHVWIVGEEYYRSEYSDGSYAFIRP